MHAYRTHTCGALRASDAGQVARLSGWVHAKRDHGGLLFIDLRDHYGVTQCVFPAGSPAFAAADAVRPESVITVRRGVLPVKVAQLEPRPFTDRLVAKFGLPVDGWRSQTDWDRLPEIGPQPD